MTTYVTYIFSYLPKRPVKDPWPASILRQAELLRALTKRNDWITAGQVIAFRTNRDLHFASVPEFRKAVSKARDNGACLLVADLHGLLSATNPDQIPDALHIRFNAGVTVIDATTKQVVDMPVGLKMASAAMIVSHGRRRPIIKGIKTSAQLGPPPSANQAKAAQGTKRNANIRAVRLLPDIDSIIAGQPVGTVLTATVLASELNRRSVLAAQGGGLVHQQRLALDQET